MIHNEALQNKFNNIKKQTLMVLTSALRLPLMFMMGCGYVTYQGKRLNVHDHRGVKLISTISTIPYDENTHGKLEEWVNEGERIPGERNSAQGKAPIHRHPTKLSGGWKGLNSVGSQEYRYE